MATSIVWPKIDGGHVARSLQDVIQQLDRAEGEVVLDWSSVKRLDPDALRALARLAGQADDKSVKIALRGVSVDVYKVLKLMKLTTRLSVATA